MENFSNKIMDLFGTAGNLDTLKVVLSNTAPVTTNQILSDITEIANSNGYTTGGIDAQATASRATGTVTLNGVNVTWTSVTGNMGPFQYVVLYDFTVGAPVKPLIAWWDYGSALTLNGVNGDTFTVKFNNGASNGTIYTLS